MSGFDVACLVDNSDPLSVSTLADSAVYDSGADTDTDISVLSTMSSPKRKPDLKNEQYLFNEIKAVGRFISNVNVF